MSGLTRDGTTEPVSRGQILRRKRGSGKKKILFSCPRAGLATKYSDISEDLCVCECVFFTLTDRASTIPSNIRGCQSVVLGLCSLGALKSYFSAPKRKNLGFFFPAPPRYGVRRPNNFCDPPKEFFVPRVNQKDKGKRICLSK